MNPNTIKTQTDAFKVRNAYLANLQAEQRNLDKTGRAVAVLQQTGQTPMPPQDTRTVTEKLGDIQKLKIDLRKQLLSITDGTEVGKIMAELGDDEVQQASMLLSDVITQLKPKYPLGVPAPVFIEFLRRYLRDFGRNLGLASGNQEELSNELRLTNAQIGSQVLPNQQTMIDLLRVIAGVVPPPPPPASAASGVINREIVKQNRLKDFVMEATQKLADSLPDPEVFAVMDGILDETERRQANELLNEIIEDVPNVEQIRDLTKDLIDAQRGGSIQEVNDVLQNIIDAVSLPDNDLTRMRQAMDLMENVASFTGDEEEVREREDFEPEKLDRVGKVVQLMSIRVGKKGTPIKPKPVTKSILKQANKIIAIEDAAVNELNSLLLNKGDLIGWFDYQQRANIDRPLSSGRIEELGAMDIRELINLAMEVKTDRGDEPFKFIPSEMSLGGERATGSMKGDAMEEAFVDYGSARIMPSYGKGLIKGKGLRSERFPQRVDYEKGIKADKTYIPFGKYALNSQKLAGGTLMIKTMKGGAIPKLPTIGISPALGGIIKKMIGGGLPSYNEMSSLSDEDKNTLYKVFKLSQIDKADLLPAPDKTKEEQEMNRFQILKGQIQAGNDNKELIKEFKVLLLKFINGGKIPKAQGMDIITELMAMGY